jgi:CheY-like chemotaxis protein
VSSIPVLPIDDSAPDRLFTGIVLARSGLPFAVRDFESADDALAELARMPQPPSPILLDTNMPVVGGFAFQDAYERLPEARRRHAAVVMLSRSPLDRDRQRALVDAAVKGCVVEPITLQRAVQRAALTGPGP